MAKYTMRLFMVLVGIILYCFIPFSSIVMNITNWIIFFFVCLSVYVIEKEEKSGGRKK